VAGTTVMLEDDARLRAGHVKVRGLRLGPSRPADAGGPPVPVPLEHQVAAPVPMPPPSAAGTHAEPDPTRRYDDADVPTRRAHESLSRVEFEPLDGAPRMAPLLPGRPATIGRAASCTRVVAHEEVSRSHAVLAHADGSWTVRDDGSSNGTLVGGRRVETAVLHDGDVLQLGVNGPRWRLTLFAPDSGPDDTVEGLPPS
jgi:hypothetical protein